jgi:hypothetical protein
MDTMKRLVELLVGTLVERIKIAPDSARKQYRVLKEFIISDLVQYSSITKSQISYLRNDSQS